MDTLEAPTVITAISDPEFEGLVSGALFQHGWNVGARAMDISELLQAVGKEVNQNLLIIYSTDFPGLSAELLHELTKKSATVFGFVDEFGSERGLINVSPRPKSPDELVLLILGNIRNPKGRTPLIHASLPCNSHVVAIGGVRHATGVTTVAINIAQEIALLGARVLLIDANFQSPALATLLDIRLLSDDPTWREISSNLSVMELSKEKTLNFASLMQRAGEEFDQIIIDLGSLNNLANDLSDRRWVSQIKIWCCRNADALCAITNFELLSLKSAEEFIESFPKLSLRSKFHILQIATKERDRSNPKIPALSGLVGTRKWNIPWDWRTCQMAIRQRSTLAEVAERSALRKEIAQIAQAFVQTNPK
ncbi:MAG: hypothetical protein RIR78_15 [Actinomycetota bacterium]